jgi:serine/threonine protein kinase
MVQFTIDIEHGLAYLASSNFVHRDIAARNMLIAADYTIKITDFGLSRQIDTTKDYYRSAGCGKLPVRWMAPECLDDGMFTPASDVWSVAVCFWEIFTGATIPYTDLTNREVYDHVTSGGALPQPCLMPDHMYAMCCHCWELNADDRPAHAEIADDLEEITQEVMLLPDRGEQPADFGQKMTLSHPHAGSKPLFQPAVINRSISPVTSDGAGEMADTVAAL